MLLAVAQQGLIMSSPAASPDRLRMAVTEALGLMDAACAAIDEDSSRLTAPGWAGLYLARLSAVHLAATLATETEAAHG